MDRLPPRAFPYQEARLLIANAPWWHWRHLTAAEEEALRWRARRGQLRPLARRLGFSEPRVSQLARKGYQKLRVCRSRYPDPPRVFLGDWLDLRKARPALRQIAAYSAPASPKTR